MRIIEARRATAQESATTKRGRGHDWLCLLALLAGIAGIGIAIHACGHVQPELHGPPAP